MNEADDDNWAPKGFCPFPEEGDDSSSSAECPYAVTMLESVICSATPGQCQAWFAGKRSVMTVANTQALPLDRIDFKQGLRTEKPKRAGRSIEFEEDEEG